MAKEVFSRIKGRTHTYKGVKYKFELDPVYHAYSDEHINVSVIVCIRDRWSNLHAAEFRFVDPDNLEKSIIEVHAKVRDQIDTYLRLKELQGKNFDSFIELHRKTKGK